MLRVSCSDKRGNYVADVTIVLGFWNGVDAKFLPDVLKLLRIGETAVRHHCPQLGQAFCREE
jgi:hypothetical protein